MKKLLSLVICLGMIISFSAAVGCGDKKETPKTTTPPAEKEKDKDKK